MKIGIFSDLHSNIYAFENMLSVESGVNCWLCLGDFTGLFPPVNRVVDKLKSLYITTIKGDHEEYLLNNEKMEYSFIGNDSIEKQRINITNENKDYISGLKDTLSINIDRIKVHLLHSLYNHNDRILKKTVIDLSDINNKFSDYDVLLYGDTHIPLISYCKDVIIINPGSCGFPIDKLRKPSYAILDTNDLHCEIKRFDYDKKQLLADITSCGYSHKLFEYLK